MTVWPKSRPTRLVVIGTGAVIHAAVLWNAVRGRRWYRLIYRACYLLRLRIWERRVPPADLVEVVEGASALAAGHALDIGCGTGTDSIYLAQHDWHVTGVDMVPEALAIARQNAAAAGAATIDFVLGDATRLPEVAPGPFTLLLDFGCFHRLPTDQRPAYVDSVSNVALPGATLLLYGFARPPRLAPMQAGVTLDEVRHRFAPAWTIESAEQTTADAIQVVLTRADRSFELWRFRLRRIAQRAVSVALACPSSVIVDRLGHTEHVAIWVTDVHLTHTPRLVSWRLQDLDGLASADGVERVDVDPDRESYALAITADSALTSAAALTVQAQKDVAIT